MKNYRITVAGTGYVGLSIAVLLSQHHKVTAVDVVPEKVEMINHRKSPIQDEYIEKFRAENDVFAAKLLPDGSCITYRNGRFDHHNRIWIILQNQFYDSFHC